jgi:PAS domain S-box-containing protein
LDTAWLSGPFVELLETLPDGVVVSTLDGRIVALNTQACVLSGYPPEQLIGSRIELLVPSTRRAEHVSLRSSYVAEGGSLRPMSQRLDMAMRRADGSEVPVDIALNTMKLEDEQLVIAAVRDASVRREAELAVEHERELLAAMNHVSIALLEGHDLDDTFRSIIRHARQLVRADYAILTIPTPDRSALVMRVAEGVERLEGSIVPMDSSMAGAVIRDREPQMLADASTDDRMFRPPGWPETSARPSSYRCIPAARPWGVLSSRTGSTERCSGSPTSHASRPSPPTRRSRSRTPGGRKRSTGSRCSTKIASASLRLCTTR